MGTQETSSIEELFFYKIKKNSEFKKKNLGILKKKRRVPLMNCFFHGKETSS